MYGVMYGDYGHGAIFLLFGIFLCFADSKLKGSALEAFGVSRYFFLMMGFFSVYMGLIYNEFFSVSQDFFGTCYDLSSFSFSDPKKSTILPTGGDQTTCVYPFGLDPMRKISETNTLVF